MFRVRPGAVPNLFSVGFSLITGGFFPTGEPPHSGSACGCFRQTAFGLGAIVSRIGGLMAPLVNMLAAYHPSTPTVLFGSLSIIGGSLGFLLPETRRRELPESVQEAENRCVCVCGWKRLVSGTVGAQREGG